jgi:uncharacterized protein YaeQ
MALGATIYAFDIALADSDRGVYEQLALRVARHPSETEEYLVSRLLAYCLEYTEGIAFSRGLSDADEPAIAVRDLTGALRVWIDVGLPDAARLHKAGKAAERVAVYTHRDPAVLARLLAGARIHRGEALTLRAFGREFIADLVRRLDRRMRLDVAVTGEVLYVTVDGTTISGAIEPIALLD